jgi:hypothetical protein
MLTVVAAAETYMSGIWRGVIPGGGGSKEMALEPLIYFIKNDGTECITRFLLIAMAKCLLLDMKL